MVCALPVVLSVQIVGVNGSECVWVWLMPALPAMVHSEHLNIEREIKLVCGGCGERECVGGEKREKEISKWNGERKGGEREREGRDGGRERILEVYNYTFAWHLVSTVQKH